MNTKALFINGIFGHVLDRISETHTSTPERTLFLQPYSGSPIVMLRNDPPAPEALSRFMLRPLAHWPPINGRIYSRHSRMGDKTSLTPGRRSEINEIISTYQPGEESLYDLSPTPGKPSLNLLHIQRLVKCTSPFSVSNLIKISDGLPLSTNRQRAGGWSAIRPLT